MSCRLRGGCVSSNMKTEGNVQEDVSVVYCDGYEVLFFSLMEFTG
jgi:hypothetical protein